MNNKKLENSNKKTRFSQSFMWTSLGAISGIAWVVITFQCGLFYYPEIICETVCSFICSKDNNATITKNYNNTIGNAGEAEKIVIQDTEAAKCYFDYQLEFEQNPIGVNRLIRGKKNRSNTSSFVIVDVRDEGSYKRGHIPGAINASHKRYDVFSLDDGEDYRELELIKDGINFVYCYNESCNLSKKAARKFASLGYPVKEIIGGYQAWVESGYEVEK